MSLNSYIVDSAHGGDVTAKDFPEYWGRLMVDYHMKMDYYPEAEISDNETLRQRVGDFQLVRWKSSAGFYRRRAQHVRSHPDENIRLVMPIKGTVRISAADDQVEVSCGTAVVTWEDRPFELWQSAGSEGMVMSIPRSEVNRRMGKYHPRLPVVNLDAGLGRIIADLIIGLAREREMLSGFQFEGVSSRVVELLCMLASDNDDPTEFSSMADIEFSIRQYVRQNIHDPLLDGRTVANSLGWSLRKVQAVLQNSGTTPRRLIKEERLALAMERLRDPANRDQTVTSLAHHLGFSSVSAFSTAFSEYFGRSPRSVRGE